MGKFRMFATWLAAFLAGILVFNLLIGVFGLNRAIVTLVLFIIFTIFTGFRTQPEDKDPHA